MAMQPTNKILITNLDIREKGKIDLPSKFDCRLSFMEYEVHEHFRDMRGKSRLAQLHLSALILSLQESRRLNTTSLTNNEYCMRLIRSCYANRPLHP